MDIAQDFNDANQFASRLLYGEETITERFLLDLSRKQRLVPGLTLTVASTAHVKSGKTPRSEPITGADWEWHFTDGRQSFGVRVQAKKANQNPRPWGYADIASIPTQTLPSGVVVPGTPQIEKLIADAKKHSCWPVYALYDTKFANATSSCLRCFLCARTDARFGGVLHADARVLRRLIRQNKKLTCDLVRTISSPLPCIVDCYPGIQGGATLPARVRAAAILMTLRREAAVDDDDYAVPALSDGLPAYVNSILDSALEADEAPARTVSGALLEDDGAFENLAGVVVVSESSEEARR